MIDNIVGLGYGIVILGVLIGVGSVVLYTFGTTNVCGGSTSLFPTWNATAKKCQNSTGSQTASTDPTYLNTDYVVGQIGSSGLAGWLPSVIAIAIGLLFLGYFAVGKKKY